MRNRYATKLGALTLAALIVNSYAPQTADAQSRPTTIEPDIDIDMFHGLQSQGRDRQVPHSGKIMFPGDHFTQAFPGDHFTPRQQRMLASRGITTISDFIATDAAVIGRLIDMPRGSISRWQEDIKSRMR